MDLYKRAVEFATEKHKGQTDKNGIDYIQHPLRVASKLSDPVLRAAAMLHDVVEDTGTPIEEIRELFGDAVAFYVDCLTLKRGETYEAFINRIIKSGPKAVELKTADINDNMNPARLSSLDPKTRERLINKYTWAKTQMEGNVEDTFESFVDKWELNVLTEKYVWGSGQIDEALKIKVSDPTQPWGNPVLPVNRNGKVDVDTIDDVLKPVYDKAFAMAKTSEKELESTLKKYIPHNGKLIIDVKEYDSFKDKIAGRKERREANKIHDVLRSAILLPDEKTTEDVVARMKRDLNLHEYESKDFGTDETYGYYGSHHFKIVLSNGLIAEVQVMPKKLWVYKGVAHGVYNKLRSDKPIDDTDRTTLLKKSKDLFRRGNAVANVHFDVDSGITSKSEKERRKEAKKIRDAEMAAAQRKEDERIAKYPKHAHASAKKV